MQVHHGRGYIYSLQYHVVWCVKYRRKVISEQIEKSLLEIQPKLLKIINSEYWSLTRTKTMYIC